MVDVERTPWLVEFDTSGSADPTVVCFPHAGGGASYFYPLAQQLGGRARVVGVQYPGRQARHREAPLASVGEIADGAIAALGPLLDGGPAPVFFGHSLGSLVAFETARRLEGVGRRSAGTLVASAHRGPSVPSRRDWHTLPEQALVDELVAQGGVDPRVLAQPELVEMMVRLTRADFAAAHAYRVADDVRVRAPIVALAGSDDPSVDLDDTHAWSRHTDGAFEHREFPGGHFYLDQHREAVADLLAAALVA